MFVQSSYVSHHFVNRKWVYNFWRFVDQVALDQVAFDQKGRRRQKISRCIFEFNFNGSQIQEVKQYASLLWKQIILSKVLSRFVN
jgi:hypothetical protein